MQSVKSRTTYKMAQKLYDDCIHLFLDNLGHDVYGDGEHDGGVVLGGDAVQGLQVPELQQSVLYISVHCLLVL